MGPLPKTLLVALVFGLALRVMAADSFIVEDIRVEGLQRISAGTVFNYLPLKVGEEFDDAASADTIRSLFQTGFFKDIQLERDGHTLIVVVTERPAIANIEFVGNSALKTEQLEGQLKQVDFAEGRVFTRSDFDRVKQELQRFYFGTGRYAVKIETTVTPLERNRVGIRFDISEGTIARIKEIRIVGNTFYEEEDLTDLFALGTSGLFSWLSKRDQYSRQKLAADLERLRSYYLDRGYINFSIDSTQVSLTPDKKDVYITVNISEGGQYVIRDIQLAGNLIVPEEELFGLISVSRGEVFSRWEISQSSVDVGSRLGDEGYAFANVNAIPDVDEENRDVTVTFFVDPGKRVYVRRINFKGNTKTRDEVLRREMRQIEAGWISTSAVERSRVRLERLGYFEDINVETPAVADSTDQVDIEFSVRERPSGNLQAGAGFSQVQGVIITASVTQENFLGTGNQVSASFSNSGVFQTFTGSFVNPYFTKDGVSLGISVFRTTTNASDANVSDFNTTQLGAGVVFGVPVTEFDTVDLGLGVENVTFDSGINASQEVLDFEEQVDSEYNVVRLTANFARDTRNSRILPDHGSLTSISTELSMPGLDLAYYKLRLRRQQFIPLGQNFTFLLNGVVGYGDALSDTPDLPLTENFLAGGVRSVRGYRSNTLGPRDSHGEPLGGNLLVTGNAEIILPLPFLPDTNQLRVTGFFDVGNVYGFNDNIDAGVLRASTGLSAIWLSPLGALTFSVALPINDQPVDETEPFQFTFGTSF